MAIDLKKELRKFALKNSNKSFTPSLGSLNDFIDVISNKSVCTYLPLINEIIGVDGVASIFTGPDFITVMKQNTSEWESIKSNINLIFDKLG